VRALAPNYAKFWRKGAADDAADLVETALGRLRALRLVARDGNSIRVLPALARYALTAPTIMGARQS